MLLATRGSYSDVTDIKLISKLTVLGLKLTALGFFSSFGINLLMDVYGFLPLRLSFDLQFLLTIKLIKFFFLAQTIYFATYCTRLQEEAL